MLFVFKFLCTSVRVFEWAPRVLGTPYRPTPPPKRTGEDPDTFPSEISQDVTYKSPKRPFLRKRKKKAFCTSNFLVFWCSIYFLLHHCWNFFIVLPVFLKSLGIWSRRPCVCQATEEGLMKSMMSWCTAVIVFLISFHSVLVIRLVHNQQHLTLQSSGMDWENIMFHHLRMISGEKCSRILW